ncbi:MAG: TonB-dependent receptor [Acidobacteriota bacterium]|nr:TonB-dependent receptor [Acidobacteriota bacterium]
MRSLAIIALSFMVLATSSVAQTSGGTLRGRVTDPSGAVIPKATVTATSSDGKTVETVSNSQGVYEFRALGPGNYTLTVIAKGFATDQEAEVKVAAGQVQELDIGLQIAVEQQHVEVQEDTPTVGISSENNAGTLVLKGKDLDALSDDPDELQSELEALAGPSAGPNGGQIYVDGFTGGQLPPKSAIREIRVNQNPFSAQYDKLGYGRIEVFTKPGTDQVHGQLMMNGNSSAFNALNPFVEETPGYYSEIFNGNVSGPLGKKASYFLTVQQRNVDNVSVVVAQVLNPQNQIVPFNQTVPSPSQRLNISPRADFQLSQNNTLTVRYQYERENQNNEGVGQFSLPSVGYNSHSSEQTVQISDTQVISPTMVNETRFQYIRQSSNQLPLSTDPTIVVQGAFTGGGSSQGRIVSNQDHYELQNYTSIAHGKHFIKFGGRLRGTQYSSNLDSNFNGAYNFSSINAYQITQQGGQAASQFSLTTGQPLSYVSMIDVGLYAEDEWRIRPNISLTVGLRYETQTGIPYEDNWAPRISLAWGLARGKNPAKTVLRGGYGIFYDRFSYNYLLEAERLNGTTQTQYIVAQPDFYPRIPSPSELQKLATTSPTVYQVSPSLKIPYTMEAAFSVERQLTKSSTVSVTYINSRGEHQLIMRNANAPFPGTYNPNDPTSGIRPFGGTTNIYQYASDGVFLQNQLITNVRFQVGQRVSLFAYYTLNFANSDLGAGGGGGGGSFFGGGSSSAAFIMNSYDPMEDWGRAAFDVRNRFFMGGTISLPHAFRLSPFILATSASPFNIIVGQDLNGDSIFNDRPALGTTAGPGGVVKVTPWGTFNTVPIPGQPIAPINTGTATSLFTLNLRLSKTFGLGPKLERGAAARVGGPGGGGGPGGSSGRGGGLGGRGLGGPAGSPFTFGSDTSHRYNLTFSVSARNLLNNVNYAPPVGNLDSTIFGTPNALAGPPFSSGSANRRIDLQMLFTF